MNSLETTYLGLKLPSPVIVSSSGLTSQVDKIRIMEEKGAGAVVLKSLFEEQILHEAGKLSSASQYPEADDYIRYYTRNNSVDEYLDLIEKVKKTVRIPVIASVNCISAGDWLRFSEKIQEAGADALELNVFFLPLDPGKQASAYEKLYIELAGRLREIITIPLAFKLGPGFTNLVYVVEQLANRGVNGVVLFNRFFEPDIDPGKMRFTAAEVFSTPADIRHSLRWVGIVSGLVGKIDVAASTGVHDGKAVVKQILAGAKAVQVCSVLYKKGLEQLSVMTEEIRQWMRVKEFRSVDEFRGMLGYKNLPDPGYYERSQFMKYFSDYH